MARAGAAAVVPRGPDPARVVVQIYRFAAAAVGVRVGDAQRVRVGVKRTGLARVKEGRRIDDGDA